MTRKKRLLIATDNFLPRWDGISRFLSKIIPELTLDYDITIIAPRFKEKCPKISNVKLIRLPIHKVYLGDYMPSKINKANYKIISREVKKADLVWTQALGPIGMKAIFISKLRKKKVISYIHSLEAELFSKSIATSPFVRKILFKVMKTTSKIFYNMCSLLLVPSLDLTEILSWYKIKTKKVVVHMGIDADYFKPTFEKAVAKAQIGVRDNIVIGYSGRIAHEKDLLTLYRAFTRLHHKYNIKLLIVGGGLPKIRKFLENKKNIIVTGSVDNILPYLHAMDIYVMPSLTETSSLATMEAMATAIPVIVTPIGHMKNYVQEGYNGFQFPVKDSYLLSKKLELLINDYELRNTMGNNARLTILENYTWAETSSRIKKVIKIMSALT
ncbi:MAG: glycosyltransferase family 4 protein [Nanoarchaeota archaeon]|nr:glycosyltransferase family 4 protein [Nanoarchaeota archaeon]